MTPDEFRAQIAGLTAQLAGRSIDAKLDAWLNREHGAGSATYAALKASCEAGVTEGWSAALSYLYYAYDFSRPRSLGRDDFRFSFETGALSAVTSLARARAAGIRSSGAWIERTRPPRLASSAPKTRPE